MPPKQPPTQQLIQTYPNTVDSSYAAYKASLNPDYKIVYLRNMIEELVRLVKIGVIGTDINMHRIFANMHTLVTNAITEKAAVEIDADKKLELLNNAIAESMKALKFDPTHEVLQENLGTCHDNLTLTIQRTQEHEAQIIGHMDDV